ncbi:MarR family winged helix-turn-helix transcriptional regulator [Roseivivax sp. THAF30]|uniref:MarR family winged helix-turn-helix transcriptional regulator n=1 Tax=Roseivivax sp. THAF30 TaxID=2587852 RepID=UPI0015625197|nr:winged helix DNA-binding protein [Roseivivax sp. THAF30]
MGDYLSATRGTVSQTLKALHRKGLIRERRSETDKRSFSYEPTPEGIALVSVGDGLSKALSQLSAEDAENFADQLTHLISGLLQERDGRSFGVCRTCFHHEARGKTGFCTLLRVELGEEERDQLCHEHKEAKAA